MKRIGFIMTLLLIVNSFSVKLSAQENLNALAKKCETMPSVDMSVVRTKNPKTKVLEREIISITICNNPALVDEFVAAFKKDEEKATRVIENKKGGKIINFLYQFDNVSYSLSPNDEGKGCSTVSIITRQKGDSD